MNNLVLIQHMFLNIKHVFDFVSFIRIDQNYEQEKEVAVIVIILITDGSCCSCIISTQIRFS